MKISVLDYFLVFSTFGFTVAEYPALIYDGKCKALVGRKCELCEGDCDANEDCDDGLVCFQRNGSSREAASKPIPGCSTNPHNLWAKDFCTIEEAPITKADDANELPRLNLIGDCNKDSLCGVCEGDCDSDSDCAEGLGCFIRNSKTPSQKLQVPGCSTNPRSLYAKDFCYDMSLAPCEDSNGLFEVVSQTFRGCRWVNSGDPQKKFKRCEIFGQHCRESCGYCRTRDSTISI